jgi:hypothetical protein
MGFCKLSFTPVLIDLTNKPFINKELQQFTVVRGTQELVTGQPSKLSANIMARTIYFSMR